MQRKLRRELGELREDISKLREDAASMLDALLDAGRGQASGVRAELSESAQEWFGSLQDSLEDLGVRGRKLARSAYHQIEERPGVSLAVGLGLAFLIGALLYRRGSGESSS